MQNALVVFTAFIVGSALTGCSSKAPAGTPPSSSTQRANPEEPHGSDWSLKLQSKCQALTDDQCPAGYGYTVFSDGRFQIGPSPQGGAVKTGSITPDELNALSSAINPVLSASLSDAESHATVSIDEN